MAVENLLLIKSISTEAAVNAKTDKYSGTNPALTSTGGICTWTVSHGLNTTNLTVQVFEVSSNEMVVTDVVIENASGVSIKFVSANDISAGVYKVVVIG